MAHIPQSASGPTNPPSGFHIPWVDNSGVFKIRNASGDDVAPATILNVPAAADFDWVNQGTATATDLGESQGISLNMAAGAGLNLRILEQAAPATPYTVTAKVSLFQLNANFHTAGLVFRESGTAKLIAFAVGRTVLTLDKFTDPSNSSANYGSIGLYSFGDLWIRIGDNGTNLTFSVSGNGTNFSQYDSRARADFLTVGPDKIGFFINPNNATYSSSITVHKWIVA
jgi:hypothetical protein